MNITELKEKLLTSVDLWADARIDDMIKETQCWQFLPST